MCGAHACAAWLYHIMPRLVWVFGEAGALDVRRMSIAAVLMNAVRSRLNRLAQSVSN